MIRFWCIDCGKLISRTAFSETYQHKQLTFKEYLIHKFKLKHDCYFNL